MQWQRFAALLKLQVFQIILSSWTQTLYFRLHFWSNFEKHMTPITMPAQNLQLRVAHNEHAMTFYKSLEGSGPKSDHSFIDVPI